MWDDSKMVLPRCFSVRMKSNRRGLSGPVGSQEAVALALLHRQRYTEDAAAMAVIFRQVFHLYIIAQEGGHP